MRDDDGGALAGHLAQRRADVPFGAGVDRRRGVVEDHDRRPQHHAARDRQPLPLATGKRYAALAHQRAVAERQAAHPGGELRRRGGVRDAVAVGPRVAVGHVALQGGGEHIAVLLDYPDRVAQRIQGHVADILAVNGDAPAGDVVEARHQVGDGRLAGARRTDDAERLARADGERHPAQRLRVAILGPIGERDVLEAQLAAGQRQRWRRRLVRHVRLLIEHLEQPLAGGGGARERVDHHAELAHRQLQNGHERQELDQAAHRGLAIHHLEPAHQQHQAHGGVVGEGHHRRVLHPDADALAGQQQCPPRGAVELAHLVILRGEGAHHANPAQVLVHHPGENRHALLQLVPALAQLQPRHDGAPADHRHEAHRDQRHERIGDEQLVGAEPDQHGEVEGAQQAEGHEHAYALDVEHAARHQIAGVDPVVVAEAEVLQLLVEGQAQRIAELLAKRLALLHVHGHERAAQQARAEQGQGHRQQSVAGRRVPLRRRLQQIVDAVHRLAHEAWNHELRQRRAYGAQYADQQAHAESQGHARDARQHSGAGSGIDERLMLVGK